MFSEFFMLKHEKPKLAMEIMAEFFSKISVDSEDLDYEITMLLEL